ncbi:hypothetical protein RND81_10G058800 [Saponaria officinalis]|uniref:F-box domain-containing protein n=1 Tax=Saponaria officinalis TaxID=3572 RepID=A0AAW1I0W3_SAPOF
MEGMNWKLKGCHTSRKLLSPCSVDVDRLSSLPDELLSRILSMLPTKDVAALQVLSKRICTHAFSWITSVDLDDSPISHSPDCPHLVERFPLFVLFVDHVINKLSLFGQPLSRFRLHVGVDHTSHWENPYESYSNFPHLDPPRLNTWISFPLAHLGLRELDLCFNVSNPSAHQLPPGLFVCTSLEVFKLDSNLKLDGAQIPLISLPKLKILHLHSLFIVEDGFITRLVSSCLSLEDLTLTSCWWGQSDCLSISSLSLERLELHIPKCDEMKNGDLVLINTPNLKYFYYDDNLAYCYSVTNMNALVQATVVLGYPLRDGSDENVLHVQLGLVRMLSNAKHLSLLGGFVENMHYGGEFKDQLPMFHNLKTLELSWNKPFARWDEILLETLLCSPNLEALAFPQGLFDSIVEEINDFEDLDLFTETTPQCFLTNLKRIVIKYYMGIAQELNIIKFFLKKASNLQELAVEFLPQQRFGVPLHDRMLSLERTLKNLPRASINCLIRVS